jgi:hypothetical protein
MVDLEAVPGSGDVGARQPIGGFRCAVVASAVNSAA